MSLTFTINGFVIVFVYFCRFRKKKNGAITYALYEAGKVSGRHNHLLNSVEASIILEIVKDNKAMKELVFKGDDLSQIDEDLLSVAISKLSPVKLS